jgi:hypothetical protein
MEATALYGTDAVSVSNRPLLWQPPSPYDNPLLFVIPSVGWACGPPKGMKMGQRRARMKLVWNGEGRLRSGLSEAVPECGLDRAF